MLPEISEIFERFIFKQLFMFFKPIFSRQQYRLCRDHGAQHCLFVMTEKCKKCLEKNDVYGALLANLF